MRFRTSHFNSLLLGWILLFAVLSAPQVLWGAASAPATPQPTPGKTWRATVGAESSDKGRQALAFLPNEIWIHAGDSITWTFDAEEVHTVTFIPDEGPRPFLQTVNGSPDGSPFPDPTNPTAIVSSPGGFADLGGPPASPAFVKGATFTVTFPIAGNYKQVCLFSSKYAPKPRNLSTFGILLRWYCGISAGQPPLVPVAAAPAWPARYAVNLPSCSLLSKASGARRSGCDHASDGSGSRHRRSWTPQPTTTAGNRAFGLGGQ